MMNELHAETVMPFKRRVRRTWTTAALLEVIGTALILYEVGTCVVGPRVFRMFPESKVDRAKFEVQKLANEAYPQWHRANPTRACPASLGEIFAYDDAKHAWDPWGSAYSFDCGAQGIVVRSRGEDRQFGTSDDIRSDE